MDYQTLHLLFRCSKEFSHRRIRTQDMSDTECMICSYIYSHADCAQDDVAAALKMDKTTVAKALASLESKRCVERTQNPKDRRMKQLRVTKTGSGRISDLLDLHNRWLSDILTCLTEEEQQQFENYCARLLAAAEELTRDHGGSKQ